LAAGLVAAPASAQVERPQTLTPQQRQQLAEADDLLAQVRRCNEQGQYRKGVPLAQRAAALYKDTLGPEHADHATSLHWLGWLFFIQGDYTAAEAPYRQALDIRKKVLGEENLDTAYTSHWLGHVYERRGEFAAAEPLYRDALAVHKKLAGEKSWQYGNSLHSLAALFLHAHDLDKAEPLLRQTLDVLEKASGKDYWEYKQALGELKELYETRARDHEERKEFAAARKAREELVSLATGQYGAEDWRVADTRLGLAHLDRLVALDDSGRARLAEAEQLMGRVRQLENRGEYHEARAPAQRAVELRRQVLGDDHRDTAVSLARLGWLYQATKDYDRAEATYREALAIRDRVLGRNHPDYAASLHDLGWFYYKRDDYRRSEPLLREALEVRRKTLGRMAEDTATSLNYLANLYYAQDDYTQAEPLYQEAIEVRKQVLGEKNRVYATTVNNLASLYRDRKEPARAAPLYRQVLDIRTAILGAEDADTLETLDGLAVVLGQEASEHEAAARFDRAHQLRDEVLTLWVQRRGERDYRSVDARWQLKRLDRLAALTLDLRRQVEEADRLMDRVAELNRKGEYPKGIKEAQRAAAIRKTLLGEDHPHYSASLQWVGWLHYQLGAYAAGEPFFRQALDIQERSLGGEHPKYATCWNELGQLYRAWGQVAKARDAYSRALAIRTNVLGDEHADTLATTNDLGLVYVAEKDFAHAEPLIRQLLEVRKRLLGDQHRHYTLSLHNLAWCYDQQGDYARAEPLYRQAIAVRKEVLGPQHADTVLSLNNLVNLFARQAWEKEEARDFPAAVQARREVLALQTELHGAGHWKTTNARLALEHVELLARLSEADWEQLKEARANLDRARALVQQGKAREAIEPANAALKTRRRLLTDTSWFTVEALSWSGMSYYRSGNPDQAEPPARRAVEVIAGLVGEEHPEYATNLDNLANIELARKDYAAAEGHFLRALQLREQLFGPKDQSSRQTLGRLASLYSAQAEACLKRDDWAGARRATAELLAARQRLLDPDHWQVTDARRDLARVEWLTEATPAQRQRLAQSDADVLEASRLHRAGQFRQALAPVQRAVQTRKELLGEADPEYARALTWLGWLHHRLQDHGAAEPLLRQVAEIDRKALGEEHPRYADDLYVLGEFYDGVGVYARAEALHRQALQLRRRVLGENHLDYARSLHALGRVHSQGLQDQAAAAPLLRQAVAIRRQQLGVNHADTITSLLWLGGVYAQMNDQDQAEPLLREALEARARVAGDGNPDYAHSLAQVAPFYAAKGDNARAEQLYRQAAGIYEQALGAQHSSCVTVREQLAGFYEGWARQAEGGGDLAAARRALEELAVVRTQLHGPDHWQVREARRALERLERLAQLGQGDRGRLEEAARLEQTARTRTGEGRLTEALASARDALQVRQELLGDRRSETARSLFQVADLLDRSGKEDEAEPLYRRALLARQMLFGASHPDVAAVLDRLAALAEKRARRAENQGAWPGAVTARREAAALRTEQYGADHWRAVDARWDVKRAEHLARLAPAPRQRLREAGGELAAVRSLAEQGKYREALGPAEYARAVYRELVGEDHPDYADCLQRLGTLHDALGDYARAEPLWRQARDVRRRSLGEAHPEYAASLDWLGWLYYAMHDYAQCEPLWRRALDVRRAALGEDHPLSARSLNNLWLLYTTLGDAPRAEPLYQRLLAVRRRTSGEDSPDFASSLEVLGDFYKSLGDDQLARSGGSYERAEAFYRRAAALHGQARLIRRKALGEGHPDYARSLERLGELAILRGDHAAAQALLDQALQIRQRVQTTKHPDYAQTLHYLGLLSDARGDHAGAEASWAQALAGTRRNLELTFAVQSERQQLILARALRARLDAYLSLTTRHPVPSEQVYRHVLAWKGAVFARQQWLRLERQQAGLAADFARLRAVSARLSNLSFASPDPKDQEAWRRRIQDLTAEKERLESDLAEHSSAFRDQRDLAELDPSRVRQVLPPDTALIDFLEYDYFPPKLATSQREIGARHLMAFVLRPDRPLVQRDLGPVSPVAEAVERWRSEIVEDRPAGGERLGEAAAVVRRLVWEPLAQDLAGARAVLVSPDGALARAPLPALPGSAPGTYLLEEVTLAVVPTPQALVAVRPPVTTARPGLSSMLLIGGVDFGAFPGLAVPAGRGAVRGGSPRLFPFLPGSGREARAVEALFWHVYPSGQADVVQGPEATEAALRRLAQGKRYLHLATHGFFAPARFRSALEPLPAAPAETPLADAGGTRHFTDRQTLLGLPPGLLSGLALAGANRGRVAGDPERTDAGILTALDVAELDLENTDLVVLSACETGLGQEAGGEGLLGLQRAFQVAGARAVVASLWQVDDELTQQMMAAFYANLWQKRLPTVEALRQAQLQILRGSASPSRWRGPGEVEPEPTAVVEGRRVPRLWAAWVLSGDPLGAWQTAPPSVPPGPAPPVLVILTALAVLFVLLGRRARRGRGTRNTTAPAGAGPNPEGASS
jgi:tetratricopeptide (TPR) repeat protein/CHAT domain-containing protein